MAKSPIYKVFGVRFYHNRIRNHHSQGRAFVAATSRAAAARLIGVTAGEMAKFGQQSHNDQELEIAFANLEVVYVWEDRLAKDRQAVTLADLNARPRDG